MKTTIPDKYCFTFTYWLVKKGYKPMNKKDGIVFVKTKKEIVKISFGNKQDNYSLNQHGQNMFYQYCRRILSEPKTFVERLQAEGTVKVNAARLEIQHKSYLTLQT